MSRKKKITLEDMPKGDDEGEYTEEFRESLLRSAQDVEQGRVSGSTGKAPSTGLKRQK